MIEQEQQAQLFTQDSKCKTRNGLDVHIKVLPSSIIGFIITKDGNPIMSQWGLDGKRKTIYPRKENTIHDLDLVNIND